MLYERRIPATDFFQFEWEGSPGGMGGHPLMEAPLVSHFPDGSGLVVVERWSPTDAVSGTLRLLIWGETGELELDLELPYTPIVADGWRAQERERLERRVPEDARVVFAPLSASWSDRAYYPPVTDLRAGQDGRILIRRESSELDSVGWQILNRTGDIEGGFRLPSATRLLSVTSRHVWGVVTDELDMPYVVKYQIGPGGS